MPTPAQPYVAQPFGAQSYPPPVPAPPYEPPVYQPPADTQVVPAYAPVQSSWPAPYPTYPAYPAYDPRTIQATSKNGWGVASLILSIAGLSVLFAMFVGSILGVIFGHMGLNAVKQGTANNRGLALGGVIVGYIGLGVSLVFWIGVIGLTVWIADQDPYYYYSLGAAMGAVPLAGPLV
jgi:hypothetical protein